MKERPEHRIADDDPPMPPAAQRAPTLQLGPCRECGNTFWTRTRPPDGHVFLRCAKCGRTTSCPTKLR